MTNNTNTTNNGRFIRFWSLSDLMQMMGDETTEQEAATMRDLLIEHDLLDWRGDRDGGWMEADRADEWERLHKQAISA